MPPIFKALATITVWTLWIGGGAALVIPLVLGSISGHLFTMGVVPPLYYPIMFAFSATCGILAVCAMKLRQMLQ